MIKKMKTTAKAVVSSLGIYKFIKLEFSWLLFLFSSFGAF